MSNIFEQIIYLISFFYVMGFTIYIEINGIVETFSPSVFFIFQVTVCIIQTFFLYGSLDYIFPQIIFYDKDYKKTKRTFVQKLISYLIFILLLIVILIIIFTAVVYIINVENSSGYYYLRLLQFEMVYFVILYFFDMAFDDFSGLAFCEYYQSQNSDEIDFPFVPMTLSWKMLDIYNEEHYIPVS